MQILLALLFRFVCSSLWTLSLYVLSVGFICAKPCSATIRKTLLLSFRYSVEIIKVIDANSNLVGDLNSRYVKCTICLLAKCNVYGGKNQKR